MGNVDWSVACPGLFIIAFLILIVLGMCRVSGDISQWEEDNLGIRRS